MLTIKGVLSNTTTRVHNQRIRNKQLAKEFIQKLKQIEQLNANVEEVKEDFNKINNRNMSAADRVKRLEEMYKAEAKIMERINQDCKVVFHYPTSVFTAYPSKLKRMYFNIVYYLLTEIRRVDVPSDGTVKRTGRRRKKSTSEYVSYRSKRGIGKKSLA